MTQPTSMPPPDTQTEAMPLPKKRKKIAAEKQFDMLVYGGLGGVITTAISVIGADWVNHGSGKEKCARISERIGTRLSQWSGGTHVVCTRVAHSWLLTAGLMMGGLAMLIPMKKAEDNKPQWVRRLHERHVAARAARGNPLSEKEQQEAEVALAVLDKEPKQTWGSILTGRVIGSLGVTVVLGAAALPIRAFSSGLGNFAANALARPATRQHNFINRVGEASVLDAICVSICTGTLYVWTHFLFPPHKKKGAVEQIDPTAPHPEILEPHQTDSTTTTSHAERVKPAGNFRERAVVSEQSNLQPSL